MEIIEEIQKEIRRTKDRGYRTGRICLTRETYNTLVLKNKFYEKGYIEKIMGIQIIIVNKFEIITTNKYGQLN